ncbi:hypothetical protein PG993_011803 [Apiospora rasikravindrae]|uniref:Uncharacterized protein n=1 Tax=Apiospora rasikravindrae TaxID=990691 RepID=A0ABR1S1Z5_9PEZI
MIRVHSSYWWTPFLMVASFLVGVMFAVGHHLFYASLDAKPTQGADFVFLGSTYSSQQFNLAVGTAFAFLVKAAFVFSVSIAYIQLFWRQLKYNTEKGRPSTVEHTDSLYSGLESLCSLFNAPVMYKYPVLFLVAAAAWLIPIASIIAPATLSVSLRDSVLETVMEDVPQIDFLNLNYAANMAVYDEARNGSKYYSYNDPSQHLKQLSMGVVAQKAILPIVPPFPNASWSLEFSGPNLVCQPAPTHERLRILRSIYAYTAQDETSCDNTPTYVAWHEPYGPNSTMAGPYFRSSLVRNDSPPLSLSNPDSVFLLPWEQRRVKQESTLYVATLPNALQKRPFSRLDGGNDCVSGLPKPGNMSENPFGIYGGNETIVQCQLYNSTYATNFQYSRGAQDIDIKIRELGDNVPFTTWVRGPNTTVDPQDNCATLQSVFTETNNNDCQVDQRLLSQIAYQSILRAFSTWITGDVSFPSTNDGPMMAQNSRVLSTALTSTEELNYLTDFELHKWPSESYGMRYADLQWKLRKSNEPATSGLSKMGPTEPRQRVNETLETMFRNFTVSLMSSTVFQPNYSDPSTAPPKVPVTRSTSQTVYIYAPDKLWAAYGAAAAASFAGVVLGLIATAASRGSYTGSLSTILRITRNAELSVKIEEEDLDGKGALPGYLAKATMRVGGGDEDAIELIDRVNGPHETTVSTGSGNNCYRTSSGPSQSASNATESNPFSHWIPEILSLIVASACIVALFTTLSKLSGQKLLHLPYDNFLNLSTLVALLATIFRSMLENVLSSVIGQLKWRWFRSSPHSLNWMETFDEASRGSWGSLTFAVSYFRPTLATFGTIITVFSTIISTFSQQAVQTVSCQKPALQGKASVPIAQTIGGRGGLQQLDSDEPIPMLSMDLRLALIAGLAGVKSPNSLSSDCASGNCTFQATDEITYSSLGFSSECVDASPLIKQYGPFYWDSQGVPGPSHMESAVYSLPNGLNLSYYLEVTSWMSDSSRWGSVLAAQSDFMASDNQLVLGDALLTERQRRIRDSSFDSITFLMPTTNPCQDPADYQLNLPGVKTLPGFFSVTAIQCYFYASIQHYSGLVANAGGDEKEIATGKTPRGLWYYGFSNHCVIDDVVYTNVSSNISSVPGGLVTVDDVTAPKQCLYGFNLDWHQALDTTIFSGLSTIVTGGNKGDVCYESGNYTAMICVNAWWINDLYNGGNATVTSVGAFLGAGVKSLTDQLRTFGTDWDNNTLVASGTVWETTVCTRFDAVWLAYPLVMLIGTLILFIIVLLTSSGMFGCVKEAIWKSSVLPLLLYGLETQHQRDGLRLETAKELDIVAKKLKVDFSARGGKWRFHAIDGEDAAQRPREESDLGERGDQP